MFTRWLADRHYDSSLARCEPVHVFLIAYLLQVATVYERLWTATGDADVLEARWSADKSRVFVVQVPDDPECTGTYVDVLLGKQSTFEQGKRVQVKPEIEGEPRANTVVEPASHVPPAC